MSSTFTHIFSLIVYKLSNAFHVHKILIVSLVFLCCYFFFSFVYFPLSVYFFIWASNSLSNLCFNLLGRFLFIHSCLLLSLTLARHYWSWQFFSFIKFFFHNTRKNIKGEHTGAGFFFFFGLVVNVCYMAINSTWTEKPFNFSASCLPMLLPKFLISSTKLNATLLR